MGDLEKALADIGAIRTQIAAGTAFQGYGPGVMLMTAALALATTIIQAVWFANATTAPLTFFAGWIGASAACTALVGCEMAARSKRHHSGLASALIVNAIEQFLPAAAAGVLLAVILFRVAPDTLWMLPGLWQVLVGLGLFASIRCLPKAVALAAAWYFVVGLAVLAFASVDRVLSPWTMGLPFVGGQILLAAVLHLAQGGRHEAD